MSIYTSLGNRGYTILKEKTKSSLITDIKKELTVKPFINQDYGAPPVPFPIYCESKRKIYMPRFYGIEKLGTPDLNKLKDGVSIDVDFSKELRPKQLPIVDAYFKAIDKVSGGGGIISVPCGYGKTVLALYILAKLKVKTLVVVHKEFLLNQWKERIQEFLPEANIGKIQSKVVKIKDKDIVIGMLQSISMIEYPESVFEDFGLVIYDECHHLGAEVFSKALLKTNFKYLLGLSATPQRADGLSKVFEWYLGPIIFSIKKREEENVKVKVIKYFSEDEAYSQIKMTFAGKPNMASMINSITMFPERLELLLKQINNCLEDKRKILVLSDRRDHLKNIFEKLSENKNYTYGYYLGGMKPEDLEETEKADVILGTFSMASEGFDCKYPLNTIILGSPKSNIEQAVGRILRQEEKYRTKVPLIIDISDEFSLFARQTLKRIRFYKKNKYNIEYFDKDDNIINTNKPSSELTFLD